jgi:CBS domain-containing protein
MTPDPIVLQEDESLAVALHKMSVGGFRHLPVIMPDRPTRVLSIRELFRHVNEFIHDSPAPVR